MKFELAWMDIRDVCSKTKHKDKQLTTNETHTLSPWIDSGLESESNHLVSSYSPTLKLDVHTVQVKIGSRRYIG